MNDSVIHVFKSYNGNQFNILLTKIGMLAEFDLSKFNINTFINNPKDGVNFGVVFRNNTVYARVPLNELHNGKLLYIKQLLSLSDYSVLCSLVDPVLLAISHDDDNMLINILDSNSNVILKKEYFTCAINYSANKCASILSIYGCPCD